MTIRIKLKQHIREWEARHQRDVTWAEISEATGIAESTLNRLINGKSQRVDLSVVARLCEFFGDEPGPVTWIVLE